MRFYIIDSFTVMISKREKRFLFGENFHTIIIENNKYFFFNKNILVSILIKNSSTRKNWTSWEIRYEDTLVISITFNGIFYSIFRLYLSFSRQNVSPSSQVLSFTKACVNSRSNLGKKWNCTAKIVLNVYYQKCKNCEWIFSGQLSDFLRKNHIRQVWRFSRITRIISLLLLSRKIFFESQRITFRG